MCQLQPQAKSQASSSVLDGFWPGLSFEKAQAVGLGRSLSLRAEFKITGTVQLKFFYM